MARRASPATERFYERGAKNMILAAGAARGVDMDKAPVADRLDALVDHLGAGEPLRPGTVGVYRQQSLVALEKCGGESDEGEVARARLRARNALAEREGTPDEPRGPSRKIEVPERREIGDVVAHLSWKFLKGGDRLDLDAFCSICWSCRALACGQSN